MSSSGIEFQTVEQQSKKPDGRRCWVDSEERWAGVDLRSVGRREATPEWNEMIIEVTRCSTVQTTVHHNAHLVRLHHFWHIKPMEFIVQKGRETTIVLTTRAAALSIRCSLSVIVSWFFSKYLAMDIRPLLPGRPSLDRIAVVDAWFHKSMHERCRWCAVKWPSDMPQLAK